MNNSAEVRRIRRAFRCGGLRDIFDAALEQGWGWRHNGAHVFVIPPKGGRAVGLSTSATDGANVHASRAQARRLGLDI